MNPRDAAFCILASMFLSFALSLSLWNWGYIHTCLYAGMLALAGLIAGAFRFFYGKE